MSDCNCIALRCSSNPRTSDVRTDLFSAECCQTVSCPDGPDVTRCKPAGAFTTILFNATAEVIAREQAALDAAACAEALSLAIAARGPCVTTYENTLQTYNPCGEGLIDQNDTSLPLITDCTPNENDLVLCGTYAEGGMFFTAPGYFTSTVSQAAADALAATAASDRYVQWSVYEGAGDVNCGLAACSGYPATSDMDAMPWIFGFPSSTGGQTITGANHDITFSSPGGAAKECVIAFGIPAANHAWNNAPPGGPWPSFCANVNGVMTITLTHNQVGDASYGDLGLYWANGIEAGSRNFKAEGPWVIPTSAYVEYSVFTSAASDIFFSGTVHVDWVPA